ncbi:MAG: hypothetical protein H6Q70_119 [Firmicutes bacterium]|nr:hypothetical protein [Bacillota bacterium]
MKYVMIDGATAVISVEGAFNLCRTAIVNTELNSAYQQGCTKVAVDFFKTTSIDSSAIRDLTKTRRRVHPENFMARNATNAVLAALKAAKLDEWLKHE